MAIYVDHALHFGWQMRGKPVKNCHLIADSKAELVEFAVRALGMQERWYQPDKGGASIPHFDLTESKRSLAINKGAIPLNRNEFMDTVRKIREKIDNKEWYKENVK